jgi:hypothetical protein
MPSLLDIRIAAFGRNFFLGAPKARPDGSMSGIAQTRCEKFSRFRVPEFALSRFARERRTLLTANNKIFASLPPRNALAGTKQRHGPLGHAEKLEEPQ